ncbi:MAG TPA: hypothetical protein VFV49_05740 [Thermoanaerobaculia bacterium]|nr:hypothetical protein [Thermoanaerobaculia bacterium]
MRKGIRVFTAAALLLVLSFGSAAFAASRDSQDVSLFARFLSWGLSGRFSPPIGAPVSNGRLSPPTGSPQPYGRLYPPIGAPATEPEPEPQSRLSPPGGVTDPPTTTT